MITYLGQTPQDSKLPWFMPFYGLKLAVTKPKYQSFFKIFFWEIFSPRLLGKNTMSPQHNYTAYTALHYTTPSYPKL